MERVRDIFLYFVAALAMFALLCAVYQAMNDKKGSALTLGTIFLVSALIVFIPKLDVLEAWGVKAVLNKTLDRAEEIIGRLQRLSVISARTSYMIMAWGNRMATPSAKEKQAVLDDVDKQLADLNVTPQQRAEITRPYIQLIGFDFYLFFTRMFDRYLSWKNTEMVRQLNANNTEETRASFERYQVKQAEWRKKALGDNVFERLNSYKFADELQRVMPTDWLDERERKSAESLRVQLVKMFEECERKGGYTAEAADFYDRYHDLRGYDEKIQELFGVNPSELR
jgi:hypothetical protein